MQRTNPPPSTRAQKGMIHQLAGHLYLDLDRPTYEAMLDERFGVLSTTKINVAQASQYIDELWDMVEQRMHAGDIPEYRGHRGAKDRMAAWNRELFTLGALQGISDAKFGGPPQRRTMRNVAGMMWEKCRRWQHAGEAARSIISDMLANFSGRDRIASQAECERVRRALRGAGAKQGRPYSKATRGGGPSHKSYTLKREVKHANS